MTETIRSEREYTVHMRCEGGGEETTTLTVLAGTEEDQNEAAWAEAETLTEEWVRDGEWGQDGAEVGGWYWIEDGDNDWSDDERSVTVEIEPDHEALICQATRRASERSCGDGPDDHDWTSEGEGGLKENPGVWSTGGTSMVFLSHCRDCGLRRRERDTGSQRNPGEHDTVSYEMPESWCAECEREECRYPVEGGLTLFSDCDDDEPGGEWVSAYDTEEEAREAAADLAHERHCRTFVARDDVSEDCSTGGEYVVYIAD